MQNDQPCLIQDIATLCYACYVTADTHTGSESRQSTEMYNFVSLYSNLEHLICVSSA